MGKTEFPIFEHTSVLPAKGFPKFQHHAEGLQPLLHDVQIWEIRLAGKPGVYPSMGNSVSPYLCYTTNIDCGLSNKSV